MSIPYIDAASLQAEIAHFAPSIAWAVGFVPGVFGNVLMAFIKAVSNPLIVGPVVDLINELSGAPQPQAGMLRAPAAAPPAPHIWDAA